jgi:ribosomal protein L30/L7E
VRNTVRDMCFTSFGVRNRVRTMFCVPGLVRNRVRNKVRKVLGALGLVRNRVRNRVRTVLGALALVRNRVRIRVRNKVRKVLGALGLVRDRVRNKVRKVLGALGLVLFRVYKSRPGALGVGMLPVSISNLEQHTPTVTQTGCISLKRCKHHHAACFCFKLRTAKVLLGNLFRIHPAAKPPD